mmetsp:Transcript_4695/g.9626  ORF Transcript_4695/g.9626 Transcript_4695/m.9626 type:complete len:102 (-) Transcript_4695:145-450(-)
MKIQSSLLTICVVFTAMSISHADEMVSLGSKPSSNGALVHEWPSLKGAKSDYAKVVITDERPDVNVFVVPKDAMVTMDFREDRVRLFVDKDEKVVRVPRIG